MLNDIMLSVIILIDVMQSVVMLNDILLSVFILITVKQSVSMLNDVMLSVVILNDVMLSAVLLNDFLFSVIVPNIKQHKYLLSAETDHKMSSLYLWCSLYYAKLGKCTNLISEAIFQ